jgi:hypothetical protein
MNCGGMLSSLVGRSNRCDTPESVPRPPAQPCSERYSALMRHTKHIHLLLASVLLASGASAQTRDSQVANSSSGENSISAARSRYAQTADISPDTNNTMLAQLPRGGPGQPFPPRRGYPRSSSYQTQWMDHSNAAHALIGAAIGFGIGAALGANSSARNGTSVGAGVMIGGGLLGLIGGVIGSGTGGHYPFAYRRRVYRPSWPDDDEESDLRSHYKARERDPGHSASATQSSPSQPTGVEAMVQSSSRGASGSVSSSRRASLKPVILTAAGGIL